MPYVKKRSYKKSKPTPKVTKATKTYVAKAITANKEMNYGNIDNSQHSISYDVPLLAHWSPIAEGTGIDQRLGDRIEPISLDMNYRMLLQNDSIARVIIFQWRPDNADEAPSMTKILQIPSTAQSVHSPYVLNQTDRSKFQVLYDKSYIGDGSVYYIHTKKSLTRFMNKYIQYNTGAVTTGKAQIYVLGFSATTNASGPSTFNKVVYLRWKD